MKKAILLLALLPTIIAAQSLRIHSINEVSVCPEDSITVNYFFVSGEGNQISLSNWKANQIWQWPLEEWKAKPYTITGNDTIYHIRLGIHPWVGVGDAQVYSPHGGNKINLKIWCLSTSLNEYSMDWGKATYYDLLGNPIEKRLNELIIEQKGFARRKIIISE